MKKNIVLLSLVCSTSFVLDVMCGVISCNNLNMHSNIVTNDGDFYARQKVFVQADELFKGSGNIDAPIVIIMTKKFEFTGTIRCYDTCTIYSEEPFNQDQFKREGPGLFTIKIGTFEKPRSASTARTNC